MILFIVGSVHVIVGKDDGELTCFNTFSLLWKLRLSDLNREVGIDLNFFSPLPQVLGAKLCDVCTLWHAA